MKLRNKKTGEILDSERQVMSLIAVRSDATEIDGYSSIAKLNEDWEDYKPQEPLINLKIDNNQKLLIEEAVAMFASQDKLRGGYHIKQAQEILNMLVNAELCGEEE